MSESERSIPIIPIAIGLGSIAVICILVALGVVAVTFLQRDTVAEPEPTAAIADAEPTANATATSFFPPTPTPLVGATLTPEPTSADSGEPTATVEEGGEAEATTAPTDEPTATVAATAPPATEAPQPTQAPPQPTDVPPTPEPTAVPSSNRLENVAFSVENTTVGVDQSVWFNFSVTNVDDEEPLPFGFLGAVVFNNAGENVLFQASWTGSELEAGQTLTWRDNVKGIGTPGTYRLQLSICYSSVEVCNSPEGDWELLAAPVEVVVQ